MLIWTARFSGKKIIIGALVLVAAIAAALILGRTAPGSDPQEQPLLSTNEDRIAYLQSLGWDVEPEPVETLQFLLPETLEEPYLSYNELQLTQGFDLAQYVGKQVTRYTYTVTNHPQCPQGVQANLYVCEQIPVAGDILCAGADGFQDTLIFPDAPSE